MKDKAGQLWQYMSRSDRHSKVLCWAVMFDLLSESGVLRKHAAAGLVAFGVNHEMTDFGTRRKKNLDLVIARPSSTPASRARTLEDLRTKYAVELSESEQRVLETLPALKEAPVGSVLVALEAKATMTAHCRALPRLYDELNSSHLTVHGASREALAVGAVMINASTEFISSDLNKKPGVPREVSHHRQPGDVRITVNKIRELPRRSNTSNEGYDALGIIVVDCRNDGSPVSIVSTPPAPSPNDAFH